LEFVSAREYLARTMHRLALLGLLAAVGGCGSLDDDRPQTLQYIQAAILGPTCGKAQCHSSFSQEDGYNFGTFTDAQVSFVYSGLVFPDSSAMDPADSFLIKTLTVGVPSLKSPGTNIRMPYDEEMPAEDIKFLESWIGSTDSLGLGAAGAQCVPNAQGQGCFASDLGSIYPCSPEGNLTSLTPVTKCSASQMCNARSGTCITAP
jgi:hypothetical protein